MASREALTPAHHVRFDKGVHERRHRALVFAIFRQYLARQRNRRLGINVADDGGDAPFVRRIGIGMDEANTDRFDLPSAIEQRRSTRTIFIERTQFGAAKVESPANLLNEVERHDTLRLHPKIRIAITFGDGLPRDFEDMAKALCHDQPEGVDLALQQGIGRNRGAVGKAGEIRHRRASLAQDCLNASRQADRGISGRTGDLSDSHCARGAVEGNNVSKGAASIDPDPERRLYGSWCTCRN
jgi:hypothetical protein